MEFYLLSTSLRLRKLQKFRLSQIPRLTAIVSNRKQNSWPVAKSHQDDHILSMVHLHHDLYLLGDDYGCHLLTGKDGPDATIKGVSSLTTTKVNHMLFYKVKYLFVFPNDSSVKLYENDGNQWKHLWTSSAKIEINFPASSWSMFGGYAELAGPHLYMLASSRELLCLNVSQLLAMLESGTTKSPFDFEKIALDVLNFAVFKVKSPKVFYVTTAHDLYRDSTRVDHLELPSSDLNSMAAVRYGLLLGFNTKGEDSKNILIMTSHQGKSMASLDFPHEESSQDLKSLKTVNMGTYDLVFILRLYKYFDVVVASKKGLHLIARKQGCKVLAAPPAPAGDGVDLSYCVVHGMLVEKRKHEVEVVFHGYSHFLTSAVFKF